MSKENILSLVRMILISFSSYFVGKHLLGQVIDEQQWEGWVGLIVGLGTTVWGYFDNSTTLESLQSFLRSAVTFLGGILVGKGSVTADQWNSISGLVLAIAPFFYSVLSKAVVVKMANNQAVPKVNSSGKFTGKLQKAA
jgi:UDP-N-acetylmuramyl pentapeptide phosphotransferase/UDP-N-acetylglucosamine-1-phosphate transferase